MFHDPLGPVVLGPPNPASKLHDTTPASFGWSTMAPLFIAHAPWVLNPECVANLMGCDPLERRPVDRSGGTSVGDEEAVRR